MIAFCYETSLVSMLLNVAIYDAIIAAWDSKYAYKRSRPFSLDRHVKTYILNPQSPSYPCEHSVTAGVAATLLAHFYPAKANTVNQLSTEVMQSRIAAGVAFPSDTRAGFEMGKKIAEKVLAQTKEYMPSAQWDGKMPQTPGCWKGKKPFGPLVGNRRKNSVPSSIISFCQLLSA
jgi:hypothetical protein